MIGSEVAKRAATSAPAGGVPRKEETNVQNDNTEIVGVVDVNFTTNDGKIVTGKSVYFTEPLTPDRGEGRFAGKLFFSTAKLAALNYSPAVGQVVNFLYDRAGRVKSVTVADDGIL